MNTRQLLLGTGLALAAAAALADDPNSLQQRKLGVMKGTAPGITLIEAPRRSADGSAAAPAQAASGATAAAAPVAGGKPAAAPSASLPLTFELKPATGASLTSVKRLEGPNVGIPLPTGSDVSADKLRKSDGR